MTASIYKEGQRVFQNIPNRKCRNTAEFYYIKTLFKEVKIIFIQIYYFLAWQRYYFFTTHILIEQADIAQGSYKYYPYYIHNHQIKFQMKGTSGQDNHSPDPSIPLQSNQNKTTSPYYETYQIQNEHSYQGSNHNFQTLYHSGQQYNPNHQQYYLGAGNRDISNTHPNFCQQGYHYNAYYGDSFSNQDFSNNMNYGYSPNQQVFLPPPYNDFSCNQFLPESKKYDNNGGQMVERWGRGRSRGRGRGRGYGNGRGSGQWSQVDRDSKGKKKGSKRGQSTSSSSSENIEKKKDNKQVIEDKKLSQLIFAELNPFIKKYGVAYKNGEKTVRYLTKRFCSLKQIEPVVKMLKILDEEYPQNFLSPYFGFCAVVKQSVKKNFQLAEVLKGLSKKVEIKQKKQAHDKKFEEEYPNPRYIQFLEKQDLFTIDETNSLFLVDCNNIMTKQKHFRQYFENHSLQIKAQGQVRLTWLFAEALPLVQLFFDNNYHSIYNQVKQKILEKSKIKIVERVPRHYAQKQKDNRNTADMKILERLYQICCDQKLNKYKIVLVSADRSLAQKCAQVIEIRQTSGKHIFKYIKKVIKSKYENQPQSKGIIKNIISY